MRASVCLLVVAAMPLAGCGSAPSGGDPGGRRLHELAHDRVFATQPASATLVSTKTTKATYQQPGLSGGGWRGPSVVVTLTSAAPAADVYRFYGAQAAAAGWKPSARGSLGVADRWSKTFPDGGAATLLISVLGMPVAGAPQRYVLSGGIATVAP
jgi:hypothetical protein